MYIIEAIFTILFVGVIVHTKYAKTAPTNDAFIGTITIVLTLLALIGMVGSDSGGCFNPTIGLTVSTFQELFSNSQESQYFKYLVVYILGPLTGAVFAGIFMRFVALQDPVGGPNPLVEEFKDPFSDSLLITKMAENSPT